MLLYLAGPMTGYTDYNYPFFRGAAALYRNQGYDVLNPAETAGGVTHLPRATFMTIDLGYVEAADALIMLPGWRHSRGAVLEFMVADALDKPCFDYTPDGRFDTLVSLSSIHLTTTGAANVHA